MQLQMHSQMAGLASCLAVKWKSQHSTHFRTLMFVLAKLLLLLLLQQLLLLLLRNPVQVELVWKSLAPKDGFPIWRHHKFCSRERNVLGSWRPHTQHTRHNSHCKLLVATQFCLLLVRFLQATQLERNGSLRGFHTNRMKSNQIEPRI